MSVSLGVKIGSNLPEICHMEIGVRPGAMILERLQVRTPPPRTFSHVETVLQDRPTTAQKLVVRHLKKHGFGPRIANRLVTRLYQHSWAYLYWGERLHRAVELLSKLTNCKASFAHHKACIVSATRSGSGSFFV